MGRVEASDVIALPHLLSPTDVLPGEENTQHPWFTTHNHTPSHFAFNSRFGVSLAFKKIEVIGCQGLWGEENGESVFNGNEALVWEGDKFWRWMTAFHPTRWMDLMPLNSSLDYKLSMHITICKIYVIVVQLLSSVWLFATPWTAACQTSWSFIISHSVLKLMSIESVMPANHLILCGFLLLLPSIFPTIMVFSNESAFASDVLEFQFQH